MSPPAGRPVRRAGAAPHRARVIRRWLRAQRSAQVRFLRALVRQPSDNPPGDCAPHAWVTARRLEALGLAVERHPVPAQVARGAGMRSAVNLVVRERFAGGGPTIALSAHGDAVPPGRGWTQPPYGARVVDGVMYGRGVAVSKSDIAAYAFALRALRESGAPLRGAVELHVTYDEEAGGGIGPKRLLEQGIVRPDYAICPGFTHAVTVAHNGCLHLEVELTGTSAHAARPEAGADALEAAVDVLAGLYALRRGYRAIRSRTPGITHPTLVVGLVCGGTNTNVVPDCVRLRLDRRILPEESPREVERTLARAIRRFAARRPKVGCRVRRVLLAAPLRSSSGQAGLVQAIRKAARTVLGENLPLVGTPLYTDARHYAARGIPTVLYGAGPRTLAESNAHRADERLALADLHAATEIVALALADLLSPHGAR